MRGAHVVHEDDLDVVDAVDAWSPRKRDMFTPRHIRIAGKELQKRRWIGVAA